MSALSACLTGLIVAISCLEMHNTFKSTTLHNRVVYSVVQMLQVANEAA